LCVLDRRNDGQSQNVGHYPTLLKSLLSLQDIEVIFGNIDDISKMTVLREVAKAEVSVRLNDPVKERQSRVLW
jgi:hypothetical protein